MDQKETVDKILNEIKDYNPYIPTYFLDLFEFYMPLAYGVGFNKGQSNLAHAKPVLQLDKYGKTIREFDSLADAGRAFGISPSNIHKICNGNGRLKTAGGFRWRYK